MRCAVYPGVLEAVPECKCDNRTSFKDYRLKGFLHCPLTSSTSPHSMLSKCYRTNQYSITAHGRLIASYTTVLHGVCIWLCSYLWRNDEEMCRLSPFPLLFYLSTSLTSSMVFSPMAELDSVEWSSCALKPRALCLPTLPVCSLKWVWQRWCRPYCFKTFHSRLLHALLNMNVGMWLSYTKSQWVRTNTSQQHWSNSLKSCKDNTVLAVLLQCRTVMWQIKSLNKNYLYLFIIFSGNVQIWNCFDLHTGVAQILHSLWRDTLCEFDILKFETWIQKIHLACYICGFKIF